MLPPPIALALVICEKVIVEEGTRNVTIVNTFTRLVVPQFPATAQAFSVYAVLTEGLGDATILLTVTNVETGEEVDRIERRLHFPDRLAEVRLLFKLRECSFPVAGAYQITFLLDGDWLAQRRLEVRERRTEPCIMTPASPTAAEKPNQTARMRFSLWSMAQKTRREGIGPWVSRRSALHATRRAPHHLLKPRRLPTKGLESSEPAWQQTMRIFVNAPSEHQLYLTLFITNSGGW